MGSIWIDALTPKQALLSIKIMEAINRIGYESIITTREYDYTTKIFELNNIKPIVIGKHGGKEANGKLMASLNRSIELAKYILNLPEKPLFHVSLSSPEAVRIAFGISIPIILLNDTPHSKYVNRLTIPLADKLIIPKAIPKELYKGLIEEDKIIQYNGVDEIAWIRDFKPDEKVLHKLNLDVNDKIIVAREAEYKASYYNWAEKPVKKLINKLIKEFGNEIKIVYFPRYEDEIEIKVENMIIPEKAIDSRSLMKYAIVTISGGGTMARESTLIGTPSISLFPLQLHVNKWLEDMGLPIWNIRDLDHAYRQIREVIMNPNMYKKDTWKFINEMEDPIQIIIQILKEEL